MASKVTDAGCCACSLAASVSANGTTDTKLLVSWITMKALLPPEPEALDVEGAGARLPGASAVVPPPVPTYSPGTPLMLITTPLAGAVSVV